VENYYYTGFKIQITSYQLAKSKRWALEFQIFPRVGKAF
jgi:hypothetical protein